MPLAVRRSITHRSRLAVFLAASRLGASTFRTHAPQDARLIAGHALRKCEDVALLVEGNSSSRRAE